MWERAELVLTLERMIDMDFEEKMKVLQALGIQNKNLTVILEQNNEHNIENVEAGGIGIQINNGVQTVNNDKKKPAGNKDARKKISL